MKLPERLPHFEGRWLVAYRIVWLCCLLGALAWFPLNIKQEREGFSMDQAIYSLGLRGTIDGDEYLWAPISDEAETAAVIPGSRLVRIGGERFTVEMSIPERADALERAFGDGTDPVAVDFTDPSGRPYRVVIPPDPKYLAISDRETGVSYKTRSWTRVVSTIFVHALMIAVAVMLFRRRAREPVPAFLSLGLLCIVASVATSLANGTPPFFGLGIVLFVVASGCFLSALLTYPSGHLRPRFVWMGFAALLVLWAYGIATRLGAAAALERPYTGNMLLMFILLISIAGMVMRFRRASDQVRMQIKWVALGLAGLALFATLNIFIVATIPRISDPSLQGVFFFAGTLSNALAFACLLGGLLVSLLRYRLYDAEVAIGNSVWVGVLTVSLLLIFAGSEKLFEVAGERLLGEEMGIASGAIAAGLAAILAGPLYTRLHRWAERTFQRDMVRLRDGLPALVGDLRETEGPKTLATTALDKIDQGVRAGGYALVFADGEERVILATRETTEEQVADWLADNALPNGKMEIVDEDEIFPIRVRVRADGIDFEASLLVGRRPDGTMIGKDERNALLTIADPLARALAISLRRTRRIEQEEAERSALKERITRLEDLVARQSPKPDIA